MNTVVKRIMFGLLALALTLSLVACGGDGNTKTPSGDGDDVATTTTTVGGDQKGDATNGDQPDASASSTTTTTTKPKTPATNGKSKTWAEVKAGMPAKLKNTTIKFFNWNGVETMPGAKKVIDNFKKETGITIQWVPGVYSTYLTDLAAKQAAKDAPDIVRMKDVNPALLAMLQPLSNTNYDFNDAAWDAGVLNMYSYKGTSYAVNMADTMMQQPNVLMYNKNLIRQYDLDDPYTLWKKGKWTWDKFVEVCTAFKEEVGDSKDAFSVFKWQTAAQMMGVDLVQYDPDSGYKNTMSNKKLVDGFQMMIKIKEAGLCSTKEWPRESFEAGNLLFFHDAIIGARSSHYFFSDLKETSSLGVVPLPQITGVTNYQLFCELEAYAVPKGAKNPEAVPYFLRYFLDAKNYDANSFFVNKTVLDVYNSCMAQKNRFLTYNWETVLTSDKRDLWLLPYSITNSTVAQVATKLNTYKGSVGSAVGQANEILAGM